MFFDCGGFLVDNIALLPGLSDDLIKVLLALFPCPRFRVEIPGGSIILDKAYLNAGFTVLGPRLYDHATRLPVGTKLFGRFSDGQQKIRMIGQISRSQHDIVILIE